MILGGEARGADAAVWRRADVGEYVGRYRRTPPVLAVEIAGELDEETSLRDKARWYLDRGVSVVWLLFPAERRLVVLTDTAEGTLGATDTLAAHADLPGLEPLVDELFAQVSGR
jgi:Uma2 family endonuclease